MIGEKHELAYFQSDFYRDKYRKILRSLLVCASLIILMMLIIIYLVLFKATPHYYATTPTGQIIPMLLSHSSR